jgi:hypothetical protein
MATRAWADGFPGAITVCDRAGVILEMNDRAASNFAREGGKALVGSNLLDCHPEPSRTKLEKLLASAQKNVYTIEKDGVRKLIYQSPWFENGEYAGLVEFALEIPDSIPHFLRS